MVLFLARLVAAAQAFSRAFSSEVDAVSREEDASKQKIIKAWF